MTQEPALAWAEPGAPEGVASPAAERVRVVGRDLWAGTEPFRVRGVSYGSFLSRGDGEPFPEADRLRADLERIRAAGLNTVRTYSVPPLDLLDSARELDLRVLVGLHYEDWRYRPAVGRATNRAVRHAAFEQTDRALARLAGRPEVLAVSVGNEVPADVVRVHGIGTVQDTLAELAARLHDGDPDLLVTYGNFPTTEFLQIDGLDLTSYNVFLEDAERFRAYLRRLQVRSGDRPVLLAELGLASAIHGEQAQADMLEEQLRIVDEEGAAGAAVFSWTDEWGVDGESVEGWGFGLTTTDREERPALEVVSRWARRPMSGLREQWPRLSVLVCAYNEERTLDECLASLAGTDYPDLEVIVADDGSTDRTREIAQRYPFRLLALPHAGLSVARNAALEAATGDLVAYLDADAACVPSWPYLIALSFEDPAIAATGGPNLPVPDASFVERVVAASPGSPEQVLVHDDRAEHVPGCNMAFRRDELLATGGFDPAYTSAGDDVDVCWKLLDRGHEIGYVPAAQVLHHRRRTVRGYLRQQRGYGRAERMLQGPHRHRFNRLGQARWRGTIYGGAFTRLLRPVVYHGALGTAPYQGIEARRGESLLVWTGALLPLAAPLLVLAGLLALVQPWIGASLAAAVLLVVAAYAGGVFASVRPGRREPRPVAFRLLVTALHVLQPFARAWGRLTTRPLSRVYHPPGWEWTGDRIAWLRAMQRQFAEAGCHTRVADPHERWDLEVDVGPLAEARIATAITWDWVPHHRVRLRPRPWVWVVLVTAGVLALLSPALGGLAAVALVAASVADGAVLSARVRRVLAATTRGAGADAGGGA